MIQHPNSAAPSTAPSLPVDAATLYPEGDGFFARRARARREKLLAGIEGTLRIALAPGETIRYAARGVRYQAGEYMFAGAAAQYHNMIALVLTDQRLLLLQIDRRGHAGDMKNELPLAAVRGSGGSLFGWRIRLADGSKLSFLSLPGADRKRLAALLPVSDGPKAAQPSIVHLCPACLRPVPGPVGAVAACPAPECRIPFRDPKKAARLSALVPGLGDLYLRHHFFGSLEFLGSMGALGLGVAFAANAVFGDLSEAIPAGLIALALVAVPRIIDHRLTLHMGRKGIVPLALAPAPGGQVRNLPVYPRWSPVLFASGVVIAGAIVALLGMDLRHDAGAREAGRLAAQGRFDDALERWREIERAGGASEERRVRLALALLEAGDLVGTDALRAEFEETGIDAQLVDRWNAAFARQQQSFSAFGDGVDLLVEGEDDEGWLHVDRALAYFRTVKRPHVPITRAEVNAHLAMNALAEPLAPQDLAAANHWMERAKGAPAEELAVLAAAHASAGGDRAAARASLAGFDLAALPSGFGLLVLEARARLAEEDTARAEVREAARAFPKEDLSEREAERRATLAGEPSEGGGARSRRRRRAPRPRRPDREFRESAWGAPRPGRPDRGRPDRRPDPAPRPRVPGIGQGAAPRTTSIGDG